MKRSIVFIISCLLLGFTASAQPQKVIEKEFQWFSTVKVQDNFIVKLANSDTYSVRIDVDERIAAHVQAYEKNGVLYLILDEKGYTKELKKELNQKGAAQPVLEATVYMPEIKSLIFSDKVIVSQCEDLKSDNFTLTASDNVKIHQLKISCLTADLNVSKNADLCADMIVENKLYLTALNSAKVSFSQNGGNASLDLQATTVVNMRAAVGSVEVEAVSGAESHISGTASMLVVNGSGYSRTDAELLEATEGQVTQTGSSKCHINITDKVKVHLTSGAMLTFRRNPMIEVDRIVSSTLIKADDPKRK